MSSSIHLSSYDDTWRLEQQYEEVTIGGSRLDVTMSHPIDILSIISRDKYNEVISSKIGGKRFRLMVSPILLEVVVEKKISIPAISVFCLLGRMVGYHNLVYTTTKDMCSLSGYGRQTVSGVIQELLFHGLLREYDHSLKGKDDRFFVLNPIYFFLGYYPHRDSLIQAWFKPSVNIFDDPHINQ